MCNFASFWLERDRVVWGLTDKHEDLLAKAGVQDCHVVEGVVRKVNGVRTEITPPNDADGRPSVTAPLSEWTYRVDQDILPDWYDAEDGERRCRAALIDLVAERVITRRRKSISEGVYFLAGGTIQYMYGGTLQYMRGGTLQSMRGGTLQSMYGGTLQSMRGGTLQSMRGGTLQSMYGGTLQSMDGGTLQYMDGGTIQSMYGGTLQSMDGGTLQSMRGGTLQSMYGGTLPATLHGYGTIRAYVAVECKPEGPYAVLIDCTGPRAVCVVGE